MSRYVTHDFPICKFVGICKLCLVVGMSRVRVPRNNLSELGQFTPSTHNPCWGFIHGTDEVEHTTNVNLKTRLNQPAPGSLLEEFEEPKRFCDQNF